MSPGTPGDPNTPVAGSFALSTVDTKSLPFAIVSDSFYKLEVTAGSAVLDTNHTFIMPLTTRETFAGHASTFVDTTRGTWTQAAGVVSLTDASSAIPTTAQWDGRKLTVMFDSGADVNTYVFTRK